MPEEAAEHYDPTEVMETIAGSVTLPVQEYQRRSLDIAHAASREDIPILFEGFQELAVDYIQSIRDARIDKGGFLDLVVYSLFLRMLEEAEAYDRRTLDAMPDQSIRDRLLFNIILYMGYSASFRTFMTEIQKRKQHTTLTWVIEDDNESENDEHDVAIRNVFVLPHGVSSGISGVSPFGYTDREPLGSLHTNLGHAEWKMFLSQLLDDLFSNVRDSNTRHLVSVGFITRINHVFLEHGGLWLLILCKSQINKVARVDPIAVMEAIGKIHKMMDTSIFNPDAIRTITIAEVYSFIKDV